MSIGNRAVILWTFNVVNLAFFITLIVLGCTATFSTKHKVPAFFDMYAFERDDYVKDVRVFYRAKYLTQNVTATTLTLFREDLRNTLKCATTMSPFCDICVNPYAEIWYKHATTGTLHRSVITETDATQKLLHKLQACIAREPASYTIKPKAVLNPWIFVIIWYAIACMYSFTQTGIYYHAHTLHGNAERRAKGSGADDTSALAITMFVSAAVCVLLGVAIAAALYHETNRRWHDRTEKSQTVYFMLLFIMQTVLALVSMLATVLSVYFGGISNNSVQDGRQQHHEHMQNQTAFFLGMCFLSVSPSIILIAASFYGWMQEDVICGMLFITLTAFAAMLLDNVMEVPWSHATDTDNRRYNVIHVIIALTSLAAVFTLANLGIPMQNDVDGHVTMFTAVGFITLLAISPPLFKLLSNTSVAYSNMFKELIEFVTHVIFAIAFFTIHAHAQR